VRSTAQASARCPPFVLRRQESPSRVSRAVACVALQFVHARTRIRATGAMAQIYRCAVGRCRQALYNVRWNNKHHVSHHTPQWPTITSPRLYAIIHGCSLRGPTRHANSHFCSLTLFGPQVPHCTASNVLCSGVQSTRERRPTHGTADVRARRRPKAASVGARCVSRSAGRAEHATACKTTIGATQRSVQRPE
jgi:hypothetical protein